MPLTRAVGTTNEIITVFIRNTNLGAVSTIGAANVSASSINFSWMRSDQAAMSSGTCSAGGTLGSYGANQLTQISSTSTLGWYQWCIDNGALASGRSVILHLWSRTSTAGHQTVQVEIDLLGNINPVSVSTLATSVSSVTGSVNASSFSRQVGVSSATVDFGVSTIAPAQKLVGVTTLTVPVGVSSAGVNLGVSTLATSVSSVTGSVTVTGFALPVGISSFALPVGVSALALPVGVSALALPVGVSAFALPVGVSSFGLPVGVSTFATSVDVSSMSVTVGVSSMPISVDVSSSIVVSSNAVQMNGATIQGDGTAGNLWRG